MIALIFLDTPQPLHYNPGTIAGMVKRYHETFPKFKYEFDSRCPLRKGPGGPFFVPIGRC
jgi:hypothetical protein